MTLEGCGGFAEKSTNSAWRDTRRRREQRDSPWRDTGTDARGKDQELGADRRDTGASQGRAPTPPRGTWRLRLEGQGGFAARHMALARDGKIKELDGTAPR